MISISDSNGRVSAWGKQANAEQIRWKKAPNNFPESNKNLDLTGSIIQAIYEDGTTQIVTQYCTFSPSDGSHIDAHATSVTVKAFYTAKSGKVLTATLVLHVVHPVAIRTITDAAYKPREAYYDNGSADFNADLMPLDKSRYKTYVLYAKGDSPDVIFVKAINPTYQPDLFVSVGLTWIYGIKDAPDRKENITVYHRIMEPSVETFDYALSIQVSATVSGLSFTETTYLERIPIDHFVYDNFPNQYGSYTFTKDKVSFVYIDGVELKPKAGLSDYSICFSTAEPTALNTHQSQTITFADGNEGSLWIARSKPAPGNDYESTKYNYRCAGNTIIWTREE